MVLTCNEIPKEVEAFTFAHEAIQMARLVFSQRFAECDVIQNCEGIFALEGMESAARRPRYRHARSGLKIGDRFKS